MIRWDRLEYHGKQLLKELREQCKNNHELNSWAILHTDGSKSFFRARACYMPLTSPPTRPPALLVSTIRESVESEYALSKSEKKLAIKYLYWLLNHSPFSNVFYTKDGREAFELGVVCKTALPTDYIVAGLIAMREISEVRHKIYAWNKLTSLGISSSFAYYLSYLLFYNSKEETLTYSPIEEWHRSLDIYHMGREEIKHFLLGEIIRHNGYFLLQKGYFSPDKIWGSCSHTPQFDVMEAWSRNKIKSKDFGDLSKHLIAKEKEILNG